MDKPFLTIIMQNYNAPKDILKEAVLSVINQTFDKFSFIFLDDWSTDYDITNFFNDLKNKWDAKRPDMPLHLIKKPQNGPLDYMDYNHGHSFCRNWGLDLVRGAKLSDYVFFADSDDILLPNCLELLWTNIEADPEIDISIGNFTRDEINWNKQLEYYYINMNPQYNTSITFTRLQALNILCDPYMIMDYMITKPSIPFCATWNKIFKLSLFNDVKFPNYKTKDDNFTAHRLIWNARKISFSPNITYFYRPGGKLADSNLYKSMDIADAHRNRVEFFEDIFSDDIHKLNKITLENYQDKILINNILLNEHAIYLYTLMNVYMSCNKESVRKDCYNEFIYCLQVWSRELMLSGRRFLKFFNKCIEFAEKEKYILWEPMK